MRYRNNELYQKMQRDIEKEIIRFSAGFEPSSGSLLAFAFLVYRAQKEKCKSVEEIRKVMEGQSEEVYLYLNHHFGKNLQTVTTFMNRYSNEELRDFVLYAPLASKYGVGQNETPDAVISIALSILKIQADDVVADFGCGRGRFLVDAVDEMPKATFFGNDVNTTAQAIAHIRLSLTDSDYRINQCDMFDIDKNTQFSKIFSNYPFGCRLNKEGGAKEYVQTLKQTYGIKRLSQADWVFNQLIFDHLSLNGKAVAVMTGISTHRDSEAELRKHMVENGMIEMIIALPSGVFSDTNIDTAIVVLSRDNDQIKMIDAEPYFTRKRSEMILSDEGKESLANDFRADSENAVLVDRDTVRKKNYVLNPIRYIEKPLEIKNGVIFQRVIKSITRGAQLPSKVLDELKSDEPTLVKYATISNIKDGMISEDLPYLKKLEPKYEKYCVHNGNLLISKNGFPTKTAVAEVPEGEKMLTNGNVFVIELDKDKIDPYYLAAFFESETGKTALERIITGKTIAMISQESLVNMEIPLPLLDAQREIAHKYRAKQDEIKILTLKLERAKEEKGEVFEEVQI